MNIIKLLIKLLNAAYAAEAKRAEAKAERSSSLADRFAQDALRLAAQADARLEASKFSNEEAAAHAEYAAKLRSKGAEVTNFLEVK